MRTVTVNISFQGALLQDIDRVARGETRSGRTSMTRASYVQSYGQPLRTTRRSSLQSPEHASFPAFWRVGLRPDRFPMSFSAESFLVL